MNTINVASPDTWRSILTPEEYAQVESVIESMQCEPKQSVSEFISTIRETLDNGLIKDHKLEVSA